jgi:hypothetical protein
MLAIQVRLAIDRFHSEYTSLHVMAEHGVSGLRPAGNSRLRVSFPTPLRKLFGATYTNLSGTRTAPVESLENAHPEF